MRLEPRAILLGVVVQNLNLHTLVCRIDIHRCTYADTIVDTLLIEAELKAEHEVGVLFLGVEVTLGTILCSNIEVVLLHTITLGVTRPLLHIGAIEQHLEALGTLLGCRSVILCHSSRHSEKGCCKK